MIIWFSGLSAAGKTTLATTMADLLRDSGHAVVLLDGDVERAKSEDRLGFSSEDRSEQVRRLGALACQASALGAVVLVAAIAPSRVAREAVYAQAPRGYADVHVATPLDECEGRDPKGLYARARRGELRDVVGLDLVYDPPQHPVLRIDTSGLDREIMREQLRGLQRVLGLMP